MFVSHSLGLEFESRIRDTYLFLILVFLSRLFRFCLFRLFFLLFLFRCLICFLFFRLCWLILSLLSSFLVIFSLFFKLFLLEKGFYTRCRVWDEINTAHERLKCSWNLNSIRSLIVLQDTAHCPLCSAHCSIKHMNILLLLIVFGGCRAVSDFKASSLIVCAIGA